MKPEYETEPKIYQTTAAPTETNHTLQFQEPREQKNHNYLPFFSRSCLIRTPVKPSKIVGQRARICNS